MLLLAAVPGLALAAGQFIAFNNTTITNFDGLYLAPAGTDRWGPNQALNDKDHSLDHGERLRLKGIAPGRYDVRLTWGNGLSCIKHGVDLTVDHTFDVRDADLAACR